MLREISYISKDLNFVFSFLYFDFIHGQLFFVKLLLDIGLLC